MRVFIAGIAGTFMAGLAQLAKKQGHVVAGCDERIYPPMSDVLTNAGIQVLPGYKSEYLSAGYDQIIIGNALSRGNPLVEYILDQRLPYISGPQWLKENILNSKKVIAVAGTHGKTTTTSMVNWILYCHWQDLPGYLIAGKPGNFQHTAEIGTSEWFSIEADEYDTAFFDKRSKFIHYQPQIAILNNLEFDHADIFRDLEHIKQHFNHLLRILPSSGHAIINQDDVNLRDVIERGCWSHKSYFSIRDPNAQWFAKKQKADCSVFDIFCNGVNKGQVNWRCIGEHNMLNALAAVVGSANVGVDVAQACKVLTGFIASARRLELLYYDENIHLYEDFAHHPTAIEATIEAIRAKHPNSQILVILELRSNTMKMGVHKNQLSAALNKSHHSIIYQSSELDWQPEDLTRDSEVVVIKDKNKLIKETLQYANQNCVLLCMSNGSFDNIPKLLSEHFRMTNAS